MFNLFSEDKAECIDRQNKSCLSLFLWVGVYQGYCLAPGGTGEACCCKWDQVLSCYPQFNLPTRGQTERERKVGRGVVGGLSWLMVHEDTQWLKWLHGMFSLS